MAVALPLIHRSSVDAEAADSLTEEDFVFVEHDGFYETKEELEMQQTRKRDYERLEKSIQLMAQLYKEVNEAVEKQRQEILAAEEPVSAAQKSTHEARLQIEEVRQQKESAKKHECFLLLYIGSLVVVILIVFILSVR